MRAKAQKSVGPDVNTPNDTESSVPAVDSSESTERKIKFRNYQPYDNTLKKAMKDPVVSENTEESKANELVVPHSEMDVIKKELQQFQDNELNIMPKKPNWDLKVQVEGKLQKLKNRTQKAIVEILREKLAAEVNDEE